MEFQKFMDFCEAQEKQLQQVEWCVAWWDETGVQGCAAMLRVYKRMLGLLPQSDKYSEQQKAKMTNRLVSLMQRTKLVLHRIQRMQQLSREGAMDVMEMRAIESDIREIFVKCVNDRSGELSRQLDAKLERLECLFSNNVEDEAVRHYVDLIKWEARRFKKSAANKLVQLQS